MLLLGICGIAGMSVSSWMAQSIQGNAHAINTSGSLRMQSYRLLSMVPLNANTDSKRCLDELNNDLNSPVLLSAVKEEHLNTQFSALQQAWQGDLRPALLAAQHPDDARDNVAKFVGHLDELVSAIDHQTEQRLTMVSMVQKIFIILTLLLLVGTVVYLRRRLLHPWRQLVGMSQAIGQGNFSQRFQQTDHQDEMAILGSTLNAMSSELSLMYGKLEQLVEQKPRIYRRRIRFYRICIALAASSILVRHYVLGCCRYSRSFKSSRPCTRYRFACMKTTATNSLMN